MRAAVYDAFGGPLEVRDVEPPGLRPGSILVRVRATGVCRSDWHGWRGHDVGIRLPHVPGHELAGEIEAVGPDVERFGPGDRVTVPFVAGCGECRPCREGDPQVCDFQSQPGFTHWGAFAELVRIDYADANVVELPGAVDYVAAASLGCRFTTAHRAVVAQGRAAEGEWVCVVGCGGVGLSAVMIARALGAHVVGVDVSQGALEQARRLGADATLNAAETDDVAAAVRERTEGGAHVSLDALGSAATCALSIHCLRKRGRHVQVGLLAGDVDATAVPMQRVVAHELEILGSHGIQAAKLPELFRWMAEGRLDPGALVTRTVDLEEGARVLTDMDTATSPGITVIDRF